MLAQYRCHIYPAFETNAWHNSFRRQNKEAARLENLRHGFSWKLLWISFNYLGFVWRCYKKFRLGISKIIAILIPCYSGKFSLIATKFITTQGLFCQCLKNPRNRSMPSCWKRHLKNDTSQSNKYPRATLSKWQIMALMCSTKVVEKSKPKKFRLQRESNP